MKFSNEMSETVRLNEVVEIPGVIMGISSLIGEMTWSVTTSPHGCIPAVPLHLWLIVGLIDVVLILMIEGVGLIFSPPAGLTPGHLPT